uniref:Pancreatic trypsin inhibitor n=1 Tax=Rhipicephalus appendiculatus TaxID=34631 RepID=A0A131YIW6_RHIAP
MRSHFFLHVLCAIGIAVVAFPGLRAFDVSERAGKDGKPNDCTAKWRKYKSCDPKNMTTHFGYNPKKQRCEKSSGCTFVHGGGFKTRDECLNMCISNSTCLEPDTDNYHDENPRGKTTTYYYYNSKEDVCIEIDVSVPLYKHDIWPYRNLFRNEKTCEKECAPTRRHKN